VAAPVDLVEVDELGVGPLGPAARRLVDLLGEDAHGGWDVDVVDAEEVESVLPVQPGRGDPCVRQPVKRDVVQDLVPGQVADGVPRDGVRDVIGIVNRRIPVAPADSSVTDMWIASVWFGGRIRQSDHRKGKQYPCRYRRESPQRVSI
jgi:hypothetical protein